MNFRCLLTVAFVLVLTNKSAAFNGTCVDSLVPPFDRIAFASSIDKSDIPVDLRVNVRHLRLLSTHYSPKVVEQIIEVFRRFRAVRDIEIVGPFRGNATRIKITIRQASTQTESAPLIEVVRFSRGDLRTEKGKEVLRTNIHIAQDQFTNLAMSEAIATVWP